jgi:hypothetical protein
MKEYTLIIQHTPTQTATTIYMTADDLDRILRALDRHWWTMPEVDNGTAQNETEAIRALRDNLATAKVGEDA